jgi:uncharacterized protein (TIGR03086 family)
VQTQPTAEGDPVMLDLQAPADELARLGRGVSDEELDRPTPCDIPVRAMLAHVLGLSVAFADGAAKVLGPTTTTAPNAAETPLPDSWRDELPVRLEALVGAWRDPAAWTGETTVGGVTMPAPMMCVVANNELVLHGWDLARATGQDFTVAPENLDASWQMVSNTPDDPVARKGLFGPVVPVSPDAPLLDRVLGAAGRHPRWSPPR